MKDKKGSVHFVFGFLGLALVALVIFVIINLAAPELGSRILQSIAALVHVVKG
jgi:hypothetical protein